MGATLNAITTVPTPRNEPVKSYAPGSPERSALEDALSTYGNGDRVLTSIVDNAPVESGEFFDIVEPHDHARVLAKAHRATEVDIEGALTSALRAKADWADMSFDHRAAIFLRAAELLAGPYRAAINASTMLGQSKTCHQAEIDAACEMIDFLRFNVSFARDIISRQPQSSAGIWNRSEYRPLDGFVVAIAPFNFTSISGNLSTAPALMGNTVLWKPARTSALSSQVLMEVLMEAGLPPGVINLVHARGPDLGDIALVHPRLSGIHFTGSTKTFQHLWQLVGSDISRYQGYPRLVGETGGKDFIFAHSSADLPRLAVAMLRGAFEYQGQKCSAASRAYIPKSLWPQLRERLQSDVGDIRMGDVRDYKNFMGAVIDEASFDNIVSFLERAKNDSSAEILSGGNADKTKGYFIEPTVVVVQDPKHELMREELFGPVLTVFVYDDKDFLDTLDLCDTTSPYALTGAIFATDRKAVAEAAHRLRFAAGNFYINDKPTGAVVGEQPFGGSRASGTNDKAGSPLNLMRWMSPRSIKENLNAPVDWRYPFMS